MIYGGVLTVAAVVVVSWMVWKHFRSIDPLKGLTPGMYQSTQSVAGETLPVPKK
jgi:hypothetical protein